LWDFGDGQSGSEQNPKHIYEKAGSFTVSLTVTGPGGSDKITKKDFIVVTEPAPKADFSADVTTGEVPLTVQFTDSSSGTVTAWLWYFGDDSSSTEQNPIHIYTETGVFTVTQIVSNASSADTLVKNDYINVCATNIKINIAENPEKFALYQNCPNPFNPQTVIGYQLPVISEVELSIYNILGQKVATLVSGRQPAGTYKVKWDASAFNSGIYFCNLKTSAGFVQIKKLIFLK
ncbi:MAG: PKD domain-containing protein, partial [Calditrichaeota bacterium]|nr:PKD domain-containing protein [Calditrichota bacterium]